MKWSVLVPKALPSSQALGLTCRLLVVLSKWNQSIISRSAPLTTPPSVHLRASHMQDATNASSVALRSARWWWQCTIACGGHKSLGLQCRSRNDAWLLRFSCTRWRSDKVKLDLDPCKSSSWTNESAGIQCWEGHMIVPLIVLQLWMSMYFSCKRLIITACKIALEVVLRTSRFVWGVQISMLCWTIWETWNKSPRYRCSLTFPHSNVENVCCVHWEY